MADVDISQFVLPTETSMSFLECSEAFKALTQKEKLYAHYLSQASWFGSLICLYQTSPESPKLFVLFQHLFRDENSVEQLKAVAYEQGLSDAEFMAFLTYVAGFYGNMGNYKSFGDTKFVPNLAEEKLSKLLENSAALKNVEMLSLWKSIKSVVYSLTPRHQQLNLGDKGITTYFSSNCTEEDAKIAQEFLTEKQLSPYNTRLFKTSNGAKTVYEVRLASAKVSGSIEKDDRPEMAVLGSHDFKEAEFLVSRGDYAPLMQLLVHNLEQAKQYAANTTEVQMLEEYIVSFTQGSIPAHKEGSRHWIRNKGPIVETYIGFIESYRDPFGVRGEFEGFVACVNKQMSAKFSELVNRAEHFLPLLPWPNSFEKDTFLRPDFTSLDVISFGSSGIPAGINIPNYDDIRQSEGFKNVSLGNVLAAGYKADTKITFLEESDKEKYAQLKIPSFEVQVGLHELLGHGSGKLFILNKDGSFNFDKDKVINPLTNGPIESWYQSNETWDAKFSTISSSYEECRAECVGIYLCLSAEVLSIFGHTDQSADDIIYINWLNMVRAGVLALEYYSPETDRWRQAHMQARYVILRVLLEAGQDFVKVKRLINQDDQQPDLVVTLDRSKIGTVGKDAIGEFLKKLQVYKSTGDYVKAKAMYDHYSEVCDREKPSFLSIRTIVLARKQPRKMIVQSNTRLPAEGDGKVELLAYTPDASGMIKSFRERFTTDIIPLLDDLIAKDTPYFNF